MSNLQALCYKCNRAKRDQDATDFRQIGKIEPNEDCPLCTVSSKRIVLENKLAVAIFSDPPIVEGDSLILPRRHIDTYFELTHPEISAVNRLLFEQREYLNTKFAISDFKVIIDENIITKPAISHTHIHLVPQASRDKLNQT